MTVRNFEERLAKLHDRRGKLEGAQGKLAVRLSNFDGRLAELEVALARGVLTRGRLAATVVSVDDYDINDLVRLSGYSARGIRHYITNRFLPRPKFAGTATRYTRETLGCLAAIRAWRDKDKLPLTRIKRLLRELTPEELEGWACDFDPTEPKLGAAPVAIQPVAPNVALVSAERWVRVPIAPGLDLQLREDASDAVKARAAEIQLKYGR